MRLGLIVGDTEAAALIQNEEGAGMKVFSVVLVLGLAVLLGGPVRAQSNVQDNKSAQAETKAERKADKSQAKADKDETKALKSKKVKKADKQQDKANKAADKAAIPQ